MFASAVSEAAKFTRAALISTRLHSGRVETGCGSYILLNADGWVLTAGHALQALLKFDEDNPKYQAYVAARAAIEADHTLPKGKKQKKIRALGFDPNWISNVSYLWGPNVTAGLYHVDGLADLAAVKLDNLNLPSDQQFPRFGNPNTELPQGTSLCKLGFPFHEFKTQFDPASSSFVINDPVNFVRYPLDGILTRYINLEAPDKARTVKFVEMSSPGFPGRVWFVHVRFFPSLRLTRRRLRGFFLRDTCTRPRARAEFALRVSQRIRLLAASRSRAATLPDRPGQRLRSRKSRSDAQ